MSQSSLKQLPSISEEEELANEFVSEEDSVPVRCLVEKKNDQLKEGEKVYAKNGDYLDTPTDTNNSDSVYFKFRSKQSKGRGSLVSSENCFLTSDERNEKIKIYANGEPRRTAEAKKKKEKKAEIEAYEKNELVAIYDKQDSLVAEVAPTLDEKTGIDSAIKEFAGIVLSVNGKLAEINEIKNQKKPTISKGNLEILKNGVSDVFQKEANKSYVREKIKKDDEETDKNNKVQVQIGSLNGIIGQYNAEVDKLVTILELQPLPNCILGTEYEIEALKKAISSNLEKLNKKKEDLRTELALKKTEFLKLIIDDIYNTRRINFSTDEKRILYESVYDRFELNSKYAHNPMQRSHGPWHPDLVDNDKNNNRLYDDNWDTLNRSVNTVLNTIVYDQHGKLIKKVAYNGDKEGIYITKRGGCKKRIITLKSLRGKKRSNNIKSIIKTVKHNIKNDVKKSRDKQVRRTLPRRLKNKRRRVTSRQNK